MTRDQLSEFIYKDSYELLGGFSQRRRQAILRLGEKAFEAVVSDGIPANRSALASLSAAVGGRHLQFVPFDEQERAVMRDAKAFFELSPPPSDALLVTTQATAAHKLDAYVDQVIEHACDLTPEVADCVTQVTLSNHSPDGLSRFVSPDPSGVVNNSLEIYVPAGADVSRVERDGETARFRLETDSGLVSIGLLVAIPRSESTTARVEYELPLEDGRYSLEAYAQPLTHDAMVEIDITAPANWALHGPGTRTGASLSYRGKFSRTVEFEAKRRQDRTGIAGVWEGLARFWHEPVF